MRHYIDTDNLERFIETAGNLDVFERDIVATGVEDGDILAWTEYDGEEIRFELPEIELLATAARLVVLDSGSALQKFVDILYLQPNDVQVLIDTLIRTLLKTGCSPIALPERELMFDGLREAREWCAEFVRLYPRCS